MGAGILWQPAPVLSTLQINSVSLYSTGQSITTKLAVSLCTRYDVSIASRNPNKKASIR